MDNRDVTSSGYGTHEIKSIRQDKQTDQVQHHFAQQHVLESTQRFAFVFAL